MPYWLALLAGSLVFGACVVAAMVLPRPHAGITILMGIGGFVGALYMLGTIAQTYATPLAIASAILIVVAGISLGYTIAASSLPHLAVWPRHSATAAPGRPGRSAIVLLGYSEPERYDPAAVAYRQDLLQESADVELPLTAVPFIFLTEKTRYRAIGGRTPGASTASSLALKVAAEWGTEEAPVVVFASSQYPADLRTAVSERVAAGAERVAVVALGPSESAAADRAFSLLCATGDRTLDSRVVLAPSIWADGVLVERLTERILACVGDAAPASVGVALVCGGAPEAWERRYPAAGETENYFIQRVRMRLTDAGLDRDRIRIAWLDWQTPDVTETVRHLAVLGCQRIVCTPATTVLPTLDTLLDLDRATTYARVPASVTLVTLDAWGDDDAIASAVRSAAAHALDVAAGPGSDAF